MDYTIKIGEKIMKAQVDVLENNQLVITTNDKTYEVDYYRINKAKASLRINGRSFFSCVQGNSEKKEIVINGYSWLCEDADKLKLNGRKKSASDRLPDSVTPPMPAVVVSVFAKEGASVVKGDKLVVVSAMKMETTLKAPYDGMIIKVNTAEGEKVNPGEILVDIKKNDDGDNNGDG